MNLNDVEKKFLSILYKLKSQIKEIERFDSYKYCKDILTNEKIMRRYFNYLVHYTSYVKLKGKVIIDAGCGSGIFSVLLSLLSAEKVYAVDYIADCIEMTKFVVSIADLNNIEVIHSDIGELNQAEKSVDGIFCIEAISHIRDYKSFLDIASRVCKERGFLVIIDSNNGASPIIRRKNFKIWDIFENYSGQTAIFGHQKSDNCYLDMRAEIIGKNFPNLSQSEVREFAKYTFGYSKSEIIKAVSQFIKRDFSLKSEYSEGKCPLDPEFDCYMENLFNPIELKRELLNYGFKSLIKSNGTYRKGLRILNYFWELLSPLTIFLPKGFTLIAIKQRE